MKVLLADDHDLVRETLVLFLEKENDFRVVACSDFDEAMKVMSEPGTFDLVVLDYNMPGMNGLKGLKTALDSSSGRPVALISGTANKTVAEEALAMGAVGFLPKTMSSSTLVNAIRFMAMGEKFIPFEFMMQEGEEEVAKASFNLTQRETQVLKGLCKGYANKELARELDLQEVTIKLHVKTLCKKLNAKNRTHAAVIAKDAGLFLE